MRNEQAQMSDMAADYTAQTAARSQSACATCLVRDKAFCAVLGDGDLERIDAISGQIAVKPPQAILFEGDEAVHTYNVQRGVVRLTKMLSNGRRQITGFLFPGDFLGLATRDHYAYSAEAVTEVELCRFPRTRLLKLFEEIPDLEHHFLSMAGDELASAQDQILLLGRKTARERVVSFLLKMAAQAERRETPPGEGIDLPMSRADIADYLGLTIETVSRTLTKLVKDDLIALPSAHKAKLVNREALEDIEAGDDAGA